MDLFNIIEMDTSDNKISKYTMSFTFDNYNNHNDITVPSEIINNAIEQ